MFYALLDQPNWQFNILYMDRFVLKYIKSHEEKIVAIKQSRWKDLKEIDIQEMAKNNTIEAIKSIRHVKKSILCQDIFGNPSFLSEKAFIQARGVSFLDQLGHTNNVKRLIDRFFLLNMELWKFGLFEGTFDFLRNCGTFSEEIDFFIDLGNFINDKNEAIEILESKRWENRLDYLYLCINDKYYYNELARIFFTRHVINSIWRQKI